MRTFLALGFSVGMTRRIAEQLEKEALRLKDAGLSLAWVPPANLHVTLKFFGAIAPESLDSISLRLRQKLVDMPAVALRARGYGAFPVASEGGVAEPPRVLWIGVHGGKSLEALHNTIEREMEDLGFPREPRPFHPHLTVARLAEARGSFEWSSELDFGEEKIPELIVYESVSPKQQPARSSRAGVEYLVRARVPFSKDRT